MNPILDTGAVFLSLILQLIDESILEILSKIVLHRDKSRGIMADVTKKPTAKLTKFGDVSGSENQWLHDEAKKK